MIELYWLKTPFTRNEFHNIKQKANIFSAKGAAHLKSIILNDLYSLEDGAFHDLVYRTGRIETISLLNSGSLSNKGGNTSICYNVTFLTLA